MNDFDVRVLKLNFKLKFSQEGELPKYKVSALRGGIGEMLLRQNCIGDRICENCSFREECVVERIYYHPLKIVPDFVHDKSNMGYLYECRDFRTKVMQGDVLRFSMLLMGDVVVHGPHVLRALFQFGQVGLGKNEVKFTVEQVLNHRNEPIYSEGEYHMKRFAPDLLRDYVSERMRPSNGGKVQICFMTPWTQKYKGKFLQKFHGEAFVESVYRRVYLANCMEGNVLSQESHGQEKINVLSQEVAHREISRFSSTHNKRIDLKGIMGKFTLDGISDGFLPYLYAGELLHIGKNTSMGFGQYKIM